MNFCKRYMLLFLFAALHAAPAVQAQDPAVSAVLDTVSLDSLDIEKLMLQRKQEEKNAALESLAGQLESIDDEIAQSDEEVRETTIEVGQLQQLLQRVLQAQEELNRFDELVRTYAENEKHYSQKVSKLQAKVKLFEDKERIYLDKEQVYSKTITNLDRHYKREKTKKNFYKLVSFVAVPVVFLAGLLAGNAL